MAESTQFRGTWPVLGSVSARTTLIASIRAFGAAFFFAGGFWLVLLLCCALPMSLSGGSDKPAEMGAQFTLGVTPTFMAGFWPMAKLDSDNLGPFSLERHYHVGPIAPFIGFWMWFGFTLLLGAAVYRRLAVAMNRVPEFQRLARRPSR